MAKCGSNDAACEARGLTPPAKRAIMAMRVLIVAGLALTGMLTWMHFDAGGNHWGCGDCRSLLDSHWSMAFGLPVALMGFAGYLLLLVSSIRFPRCPWSLSVSALLATALAGGGMWFIGVQAFALHRWCGWCTTTHVISIALAAIIVPMTWRRIGNRPVMLLLIAAGLMSVAAMAAQQLNQRPSDVRVIGDGAAGRVNDDGMLVLLDGKVKIALGEHIIIGSPSAKKFVVEAMDFRCHGCSAAWPVVEQAQKLLGGEVAVVVLLTPVCADCNMYIKNTPEGFELSCELAKLAWAVWLAAPEKYPSFHQWLLTHQQCTLDEAKSQARQLAGEGFDRAAAAPRIDTWIRRDVEIAAELGMEQLPAMIAGRLRIGAVPDDAQTLAMLWATGLAGK